MRRRGQFSKGMASFLAAAMIMSNIAPVNYVHADQKEEMQRQENEESTTDEMASLENGSDVDETDAEESSMDETSLETSESIEEEEISEEITSAQETAESESGNSEQEDSSENDRKESTPEQESTSEEESISEQESTSEEESISETEESTSQKEEIYSKEEVFPEAIAVADDSENLLPNGSFETTIVTTDTNLKKFWKDSIVPKGWEKVWDVKGNSQGKIQFSLDTDQKMDGNQAVLIEATDAAARLEFYQILEGLDLNRNYLCSFQVKAENVKGDGFYLRVDSVKTGSGTQDSYSSSKIKGSTDGWQTVVVPVKDMKPGVDKLQINFFTDFLIGKIWVDDVKLVKDYRFSLKDSAVELYADDTYQLEEVFDQRPDNITIEWSSSDESIATVDENGMVTAHKMGMTTISAKIDETHVATCEVQVKDASVREIYQEMRQKWRDRLTGSTMDETDADYQGLVNEIEQEAREYWESMILPESETTDTRDTLWEDLNLTVSFVTGNSNSNLTVGFQTAFERIEKMALAYTTKGSGLYQDETLKNSVIDALEWMYEHVYREDYNIEKELYGNWWHWQIGMPQSLCNTVILMYDVLPRDLIQKEARTLERFNENPNYVYKISGWGKMDMTSANLMDTSLVSVLRSIIQEDSEAVGRAKEAFSKVLPYVTKEDGFYEDGSCIQHTNLAYTGGYGSTLLSGIEKILFLVNETPWEIEDPNLANVYEWILEGYRPLFADGAIMDMVSGRGIARPSRSDQSAGKGVLKAVTRLAAVAPAEVKEDIESFAKTHIMAGISYDPNYYSGMNISDMAAMKTLMQDSSVPILEGEYYYKGYGVMDKAVHHGNGFSLGISMYSSRTGSFEYGNGENIKGWHMSDGALYLYNGDQAQYADQYWPTVDPMRLAGITTDHTEGTIADAWTAHTSTKNWVGGSSVLGKYGATGMEFEIENSTLTGKKSWFSFENEVVALGAGISSSEQKDTETIVENRKIRDDASNRIWIDGLEESLSEGSSVQKSVNWILLEGNQSESQNIGYYFPEQTSVEILQEERTGNWRDINTAVSSNSEAAKDVTRQYFSIAIPHGKAPVEETYSYILVPNTTKEEMKQRNESSPVEILANTSHVQAVKQTELGVSGYNFWDSSSVSGVKAQTPASVMIAENGNQRTVSISDPTQKNGQTVITLSGIYEILSADDTVKGTQIGNEFQITVNTKSDLGRTHSILLEKADEDAFETLRGKLYKQIMGIEAGTEYDLLDETSANMVTSLNAEANKYWDMMNKSDVADRTEIFKGVKPVLAGGPNSNSANLTQTYKYLFKLVQAYETNGTDLYQDEDVITEVLSAIDFTLNEKWYGREVPTNSSSTWYYGNWWDHRIGVPAQLLPIMVLLHDNPQLTKERYQNYMDAMIYQKADDWGNYVSANLADIGQNAMYIGILNMDATLLKDLKERFGKDMFAYTIGNGWHMDGSYIDHEKFAYTGGYGSVMIGAMSRILPILEGSPYEMRFGDERDNFYEEIVLKGYLPLHYNGTLTDSVRGRSITRETAQRSSSAGHLALISQAFSQEKKQIVQSVIKGWLEADPDILKALTRPAEIMACKEILKDSSIKAGEIPEGFYCYNDMDKAVMQNDSYMGVVSMHSNKIANYEYLNGEGKKLWNISDGAFFLYNEDINQFRDNYWATIDHLRIPATTTLHDESRSVSLGFGTFNPNVWVSSIRLGNIGLSGMQIKTLGKTASRQDGLLAKKSYFLLGDKIVFLGSDIKDLANNTAHAETIVENRKISQELQEVLLVNGEPVNDEDIFAANWAHLSGNQTGEIGYVFLTPTEIHAKKELRSGYWKDVNDLENMRVTEDAVSAGYATMYIDHGVNPTGAAYDYVILPNYTKEQTEEFQKNPTVEILANDEKVHAVYDTDTKTTGANFWTSKEVSVGKITASRFATVLLQEQENGFSITVADPTHNSTEKIKVIIDLPAEKIVIADEKIEVVSIGEKVELLIDVVGADKNKTFSASFLTHEEVETPSEPETPSKSEEPSEPETPSESEEPSEPETPSESEEPTEPETPSESEEPSEPETPNESEEPTEPETPSESEEPSELETPSESEEPSEPDESEIPQDKLEEQLEEIIKDLPSTDADLTEKDKEAITDAVNIIQKMDEEQKMQIKEEVIEQLDTLFGKANELELSIPIIKKEEISSAKQIDKDSVQVKGAYLASGTESGFVEVEIIQQNPTKEVQKAQIELKMTLKVNGNIQQLCSPMFISVELPSGVNTRNLLIKHYSSDGRQLIETLQRGNQAQNGFYSLNGRTITMKVNEFSVFSFISETEEKEETEKTQDSDKATSGWVQKNGKWHYVYADGTQPIHQWEHIGNKWYFFDANGECQTGWIGWNSLWYYAKEDASMAASEWIFDQNKWYYMADGGNMAAGWIKVQDNWYYLNSDGSMKTGWHEEEGWYYLGADGIMLTSWNLIDGKWYYMRPDGMMETETIEYLGKQYRFSEDGSCINPY